MRAGSIDRRSRERERERNQSFPIVTSIKYKFQMRVIKLDNLTKQHGNVLVTDQLISLM